jgi:hypothetical protein
MKGSVHGGQQPIVGAHVYLFAANTTGYGNASVSLLTSAGNTALDTSGGATDGDYYVTTGAGGGFTITGDYTCTANTQVYLYALGGNPGLGSGTNAAAGLLAALGNCPGVGNFLSAIPFIAMNEVSTVAAAYAFSGFATDATHVSSSGTALAQVGIANAFANVANLETLSTGVALATTPAGNGTVPQSTINTLANILAACINSNGAVTGPTNPSACYTLFNNATTGGTSPTTPTDTATAAINIAHNPGTNVGALYALSTPTPPFAPALSGRPNDFSIAILLTGGGLNTPDGIAIDGSGNVWIVCAEASGVAEFSNSGAVLSGANGYGSLLFSDASAVAIDQSADVWVATFNAIYKFSGTGSLLSGTNGYADPGVPGGFFGSLAIDGSGNVWAPAPFHNYLTELSNSGVLLTGGNGYSGGGLEDPDGVSIDSSGNVWLSNTSGNNVSEFTNAGVPLSNPNGYVNEGDSNPVGIAIDGPGNAWIVNYNDHSVIKISSAGAVLASATFLNYYYPVGIAIDGSGNVWVPTVSSVFEFSSSGILLSPQFGYAAATPVQSSAGGGAAIDGSGNVWSVSGDSSILTEIVGAATPVVTPISVGVKNNTLGTLP